MSARRRLLGLLALLAVVGLFAVGPLLLPEEVRALFAGEAGGLRTAAGRLAAATGSDPLLALALAAATFLSEDLACVAGGLLSAAGRVGFWWAVAGCALGIVVGDLAIYFAGRAARTSAEGAGRWQRRIGASRLARASHWLRRRGAAAVLVSRFLPGTRVATFFALGAAGAPALAVAGWQVVAAGLWTPVLVGAAHLLGAPVVRAIDTLSWRGVAGLAGVVAVVAGILRLAQLAATRRGRRRLASAWRRWTRWEFWPFWMLYATIAPQLVALAVRHGSASLFTAANPGLPGGGGFAGESKAEILALVPEGSVARFRRLPVLLPPAERLARARAFAAEEELELPLVLKPDVGERGRGVVVARSWEEIERVVGDADRDLLVQEYVPGVEVGLYRVRLPGEPRGRLTSVTEKRLPAVVGDGSTTVRELLFADRRLATRAPLYLSRLGADAERVPDAGEEVRLAELGNHCRGADFLDGAHLATPRLEAWVEALCRSVPGFFLGRLDVRAPSWEAVAAGRDLKLIELNGVASEPSHIYDPRHGLGEARRALLAHWRDAFEAGRRNRERGAEPTPWRRLARPVAEALGWLSPRPASSPVGSRRRGSRRP